MGNNTDATRKRWQEWSKDRNHESRTTAVRVGRRWSTEDDEFVLDTLDDPVDAVAACLGRTIQSVINRRWQLRSGHGVAAYDDTDDHVYGPDTHKYNRKVEYTTETCTRCSLQHRGEC